MILHLDDLAIPAQQLASSRADTASSPSMARLHHSLAAESGPGARVLTTAHRPKVRPHGRTMGQHRSSRKADVLQRRNRHGATMTASTRAEWLVPAGLITLSLVRVLRHPRRRAAWRFQRHVGQTRFFAASVSIVGVFQLAPDFRRRRRAAGRLLVRLGLAGALYLINIHRLEDHHV